MLPALLAVLGGALLTATLNAAGLRVGATPAELVLWGACGVLFARVFSLAPLVLALPVVLAGIELAAGFGGVAPAALASDPLTLALPDGRALALVPLVAGGAYGAWAQRFDLRPRLIAALAVAILAASVEVDLPAVTLLGLALLAPNADRLGGLLRTG